MPTPGRLVRLDDPQWVPAGWLANELGTDRSAVLRQLLAWWARQPGARLPARPTPEQAAAARARYETEQAIIDRARLTAAAARRRGTPVVNG